MTAARAAAIGLAALFAASCVSFPEAPAAAARSAFSEEGFRSLDGALLGLNIHEANAPTAVVVAVHGMNDYARAFDAAGKWWSQAANLAVYAYDQRGFGRSPGFRRWAGSATMKADLRAAIAAARDRHPGLPVYVVGHSMGAGVVLAAAGDAPLDVDGVVLVAPGVWGGARLSIAYRIALNVSAALAPGKTLTGERAKRQATDNIPLLRMMVKDPLVIKATRMETILGAVRVMGAAWDASDEVGGAALVLYGAKDEIIPVSAMQDVADRLCGAVETRAYPEGWHMLLDDLQAERVWRDVADWIAARGRAAQGLRPAAAACSSSAGA